MKGAWSQLGLLLASLGLATAVMGCMVHTPDPRPLPKVQVPARFTHTPDPAGLDDGEFDPGKWWTSFEDPALNDIVDEALTNNLELLQAWARLEQAQAMGAMAWSGLSPTLDASGGAGRSKGATREMTIMGQTQTIEGSVTDSLSASLPMSYEVDLWGRVRSGIFASQQDERAVRADVETAAITIAANVTEQWFNVIEKRALRQLLDGQLRTNQVFLELVELRFKQGDAALSEIYQQRQQVQATRAQLELIDGQQIIADQQLAVLLGKPPQSVVPADHVALPPPPILPAAGLPIQLLERRPDLRAARQRVVAADFRVGEAIANRLPRLQLSGDMGFSSNSMGTFFDSFIWSFIGGVSGSIWDGGRKAAEQERTEAVVKERLHAFGQKLLNALLEVESSLVRERQQRRYLAVLDDQVSTARRTLSAARRRYHAGLGNFLPVLTSLRSLHQAEQSRLSAQRQLLSHRVQLYRALGGSWTTELEPPIDEEEDDDVAESDDDDDQAPDEDDA